MRRACAVATLAVAVPAEAFAQGGLVEIQSFQNGVVVWSNANSTGLYSLEWARNATGPWYKSWEQYHNQVVTGFVMKAAIPRFFRVMNTPDQVEMEWVVVANAHNGSDSTGYGTVNYTYRIGRYEVSNEQYARFLNAVDPSGANTRALYNPQMATSARGGITNDSTQSDGFHYVVKANMSLKPVNFVSFWDSARFANWLHNGQGNASTETGAYDLTSTSPANSSVSRMPGAVFFIPSEDEWYKAAYYEASSPPIYWAYPIRSDTPPTIARCNSIGSITNDSAHTANYAFGAVWKGVVGNVTSCGSGGPGSATFYGAMDMAGNVYEWNEGIIDADLRCIRGGGWHSASDFLVSSVRNGYGPDTEVDTLGLRMARVP